MTTRTRFEVISVDGRWILSSLTLFGDMDENAKEALHVMIAEAMGIAMVSREGLQEVRVRRTRVDIEL